MWRIKFWLSDLGIWLWFRFGNEKIHIAFRHTCGSEAVQLANFRGFGPEFQCFKCNASVPSKDMSFRILSAEEIEKIKTEAKQKTDCSRKGIYEYFKSGVLPLPHFIAS